MRLGTVISNLLADLEASQKLDKPGHEYDKDQKSGNRGIGRTKGDVLENIKKGKVLYQRIE